MENIKSKFLALVSPLILALAVINVHLSGNDNAPTIVFLVLVIVTGIFIITGIITLLRNSPSTSSRLLCLGSALTLTYVAIAVLLSAAGLVEQNILLGFE